LAQAIRFFPRWHLFHSCHEAIREALHMLQVALLTLLAHNVASAKLKAVEKRLTPQAKSDWCNGNVFPYPDKHYGAQGLRAGEPLFGGEHKAVAAALAAHADWHPGSSWEFKARVTSGYAEKVKFGFASGFLEFEVGPDDLEVDLDDLLKSTTADEDLEYRPNATMPAVLSEHSVTFSDICLRPRSCAKFAGCPPHEYALEPENLGNSIAKCCKPVLCKDQLQAACEPADEWSKHPDFDTTKTGDDNYHCCVPKHCDESVCKPSSQYKLVTGDMLGSTQDKCCVEQFCEDFNGCSKEKEESKLNASLPDGSLRLGSTEEECCHLIECSEFNCTDGTQGGMWKARTNPSGKGHDYGQCCDPVQCDSYKCSVETKLKLKPVTFPSTQGFSDELCCEKRFCKVFDCESETKGTHEQKISGATRAGSTVEECCDVKLCEQYNCSDGTKFVKMSTVHHDEKGLQVARVGFSDEQCCQPKYCRNFDCSHTKWKDRGLNEDDTTQGSTYKECCDKVLCKDRTCTTDYDGDGFGTQWDKKVIDDIQGSTDEECCNPKYCYEHQTKFPTKWKRKMEPAAGKQLKGSTDDECYVKMLCNDYCGCKPNDGYKMRSDANATQGSTVEECCVAVEN